MKYPEFEYLIYDLESVPNMELFAAVKYPGLSPEEAFAAYQEKTYNDNPFIPLTFHYPVSIAALKVSKDFRPTGRVKTLYDQDGVFRSEDGVRRFWLGVAKYQPTLVDFNGRGFDLPVLTMSAYSQGLQVPEYFSPTSRMKDYRYRYGQKHIDLMDWFTGHGAFRMTGGLDLLAKMAGGPGKLSGVDGSQVAQLYLDGKIDVIHEYCRRDVIETYRVFLRTRRLMGLLNGDMEESLMKEVL
jgi:predicted PolB exonuclease-like 3'-5' exonuclease